MARAWVSLIWSSLAVAVVAAAAQLGVADAVGIIRWKDASPAAWSTLLTWVAFIYAVAVLSGASVGRRALRRPGRPDGAVARVLAAFVAGLGATAALLLVWLQAQNGAPRSAAFPDLVAATAGGAGIVVGTVLAVIAAGVPAVSVGVRATVGWVWFVGVGCAVIGYLTHRPFPAPRLGVVDAPSLVPVSWWSGPIVMIAVAVLLGAAVAAVARWGGARRLGAAGSGVAGPAVVAAAYLIAWPGMGSAQPGQLEPYRAAMIAVGAGLVASAVVALLPRRRPAGVPKPKDGPVLGAGARSDAKADAKAAARAEGRARAEARAQPQPQPRPLPQSPPRAQAPDLGLMGQPRTSFEEDYSDWLRELGHVPHSDNGPTAVS